MMWRAMRRLLSECHRTTLMLQQIYEQSAIMMGSPLDLVSRCRDTLHFHAAICADKENLCLGAHLPQRVGYRHGGEDMASRAAADDYPQFFVHCVRFEVPSAANLLQR